MDDARRGWWSRHWKWAVPGGCLLVVVLLFGGCVALVAGLFGAMKNTGAYTIALERLRADDAAVAALGRPIDTGWAISGHFNDRGDAGEATYAVPVHGPRGHGRLHVDAVKRKGRWSFRVLELVPESDAPAVDLRTPAEVAEFGDVEFVPAEPTWPGDAADDADASDTTRT
jgi:hypothetical protein